MREGGREGGRQAGRKAFGGWWVGAETCVLLNILTRPMHCAYTMYGVRYNVLCMCNVLPPSALLKFFFFVRGASVHVQCTPSGGALKCRLWVHGVCVCAGITGGGDRQLEARQFFFVFFCSWCKAIVFFVFVVMMHK